MHPMGRVRDMHGPKTPNAKPAHRALSHSLPIMGEGKGSNSPKQKHQTVENRKVEREKKSGAFWKSKEQQEGSAEELGEEEMEISNGFSFLSSIHSCFLFFFTSDSSSDQKSWNPQTGFSSCSGYREGRLAAKEENTESPPFKPSMSDEESEIVEEGEK